MRLDRLATLYLANPLRKLAPANEQGCVRILMYHRISDAPEPDLSPYFRVNTSPSRFAEQMQLLADEGYKVIDLCDALSSLRQGLDHGRHVVITFDDGYSDFAESAFPILRKHSFTATVYLPTAYISDSPRSFRDTNCLTWSEVRDLRRAGIRFGSHTVTHPTLRELPWSEIKVELSQSKAELEQQLGEPVTAFAYPYAWPEGDARFVRQFISAVREAGYQSCATTRIGIARTGDDPFTLKRLPVNDCDDAALFRAKLQGAYNWLAIPQRLRKKSTRAKQPGSAPIETAQG